MNQFSIVRTATKEDMVVFQQWTEQSQPTAIEERDEHSSFFQANLGSPDVVPIESHALVRTNPHPSHAEHHIPSPDVHHLPEPFRPEEFLKVDQLRAYQIIVWHLEETLADRNPPLLHLIINGEGGTGKSRLIEAITNYFAYRGVSHYLVKMAYTGVAASHIQGVTCHSAAMIGHNQKTMSNKTKAKLQEFWAPVLYKILDEFSMLGKTFFAKLSRNISIGKTGATNTSTTDSWGGTSVIVTGDEHQFPPMACSIHEALYFPSQPSQDSALSLIG